MWCLRCCVFCCQHSTRRNSLHVVCGESSTSDLSACSGGLQAKTRAFAKHQEVDVPGHDPQSKNARYSNQIAGSSKEDKPRLPQRCVGKDYNSCCVTWLGAKAEGFPRLKELSNSSPVIVVPVDQRFVGGRSEGHTFEHAGSVRRVYKCLHTDRVRKCVTIQ